MEPSPQPLRDCLIFLIESLEHILRMCWPVEFEVLSYVAS